MLPDKSVVVNNWLLLQEHSSVMRRLRAIVEKLRAEVGEPEIYPELPRSNRGIEVRSSLFYYYILTRGMR